MVKLPFAHEIGHTAFLKFCSLLKQSSDVALSTMDCFRSVRFQAQYSLLAHALLEGTIARANQTLNDPQLGIALIDIPELHVHGAEDARVFGMICAAALFAGLTQPLLV